MDSIFRILLLVTWFLECCDAGINIALHAQVSPSEKIVGSVITTNGLREAFKKLPEINYTQIYYPFHYPQFFEYRWQLILIEGWFPSINDFLALARSNNPHAIVLFYCLDPTYPGLSVVSKLDVDGYLTNSQPVMSLLQAIAPTHFLPLAADTDLMSPNHSVSRTWTSVYVGAGGGMVKYKPILLEMLRVAVPFGLRLHGSHWNEVSSLKDVWLGILPQFELANVYSSAQVVIATTIQSQGRLDMINNRIFEALACGSIIITDDWPVLHEVFGDLLLYAKNGDDVRRHIEFVLQHPQESSERRERARERIVRRHTWSHRVVEIMSFYHHLYEMQSSPKILYPASSPATVESGIIHDDADISGDTENAVRASRESGAESSRAETSSQREVSGSRHLHCVCPRENCPQLAWIISTELLSHSDYSFIAHRMQTALCLHYNVEVISETVWNKLHMKMTWLCRYDLLLAVTVPFAPLDLSFLKIPRNVIVHRNNKWQKGDAAERERDSDRLHLYHEDDDKKNVTMKIQKHAAIWIGFNRQNIINYLDSYRSFTNTYKPLHISHYDTIWYRDGYELDLLSQSGITFDNYRLQHFFTVLYPPSTAEYETGTVTSISWKDARAITKEKERVEEAAKTKENLKTNVTSGRHEVRTESDGSQDHSDQTAISNALFICFFPAAHLCVSSTRHSVYTGESNLLLVGGTWDEWLDREGVIESVHPSSGLHQVTLVSTGYMASAMRLIQSCDKIYIMNEKDQLIETNAQKSKEDGGEGDILNTILTTEQDIIWPVLMAIHSAKSLNSNKQLHLLQYNSHLLHHIDIDYNIHDIWYLPRAIGYGIARLHGFGSSAAGVSVISPIKQYEAYQSPTGEFVFKSISKIDNFKLGLQGQCCYIYKNNTLGCVIRTDVDVFFRINSTASNCMFAASSSSMCIAFVSVIVITVELRGPMFSDAIASTTLNIEYDFYGYPKEFYHEKIFIPTDNSLVLDITL